VVPTETGEFYAPETSVKVRNPHGIWEKLALSDVVALNLPGRFFFCPPSTVMLKTLSNTNQAEIYLPFEHGNSVYVDWSVRPTTVCAPCGSLLIRGGQSGWFWLVLSSVFAGFTSVLAVRIVWKSSGTRFYSDHPVFGNCVNQRISPSSCLKLLSISIVDELWVILLREWYENSFKHCTQFFSRFYKASRQQETTRAISRPFEGGFERKDLLL